MTTYEVSPFDAETFRELPSSRQQRASLPFALRGASPPLLRRRQQIGKPLEHALEVSCVSQDSREDEGTFKTHNGFLSSRPRGR